MDIDNFNDALYTYKYMVKINKLLYDKKENQSLFYSTINVYRKTILSSIDTVTLDLFLTEDNIKTQESDNIDAYGLLAIEHYLKFIEVNKYPDEKYKGYGKIILKGLKLLINSDYELPEWVWSK